VPVQTHLNLYSQGWWIDIYMLLGCLVSEMVLSVESKDNTIFS